MKTKRIILIYVCLLIVPAVVIGGWALKLLSHEKDRLKAQAVTALTRQAQNLAETLELTVADVEEALSRSLLDVDSTQLEDTLKRWQDENPLVRNVFVWRDNRLVYPVEGLGSTPEERRFASRYEALFSGRMDFGFGQDVSRDEWAVSEAAAKTSDNSPARQAVSARKDLVNLARIEDKGKAEAVPELPGAGTKPVFVPKSGWIPWFAENRLFILGYARKLPKGPVYGLELELMTLLSRMITQVPAVREPGAAFGLVAGDGELVHQAGGFPIDVKKQPDISVPLSGLLPHYRVNVYFSDRGVAGDEGYITLSVLLVLLFSLSMVLGGILLIRDIRRNMKDAMEKTSFVSSVSHELKTPLTSIRMYAELLAEGRVKEKEKVGRYLSVIVTESQRLTRLVNNVLDFGRLEQGKKTYHPMMFDLVAFIRTLFEAHNIRLAQAGLVLDLRIPEGPFTVRTDRDALEQVVLNLLDNAVKYASEGKYLGFFLEASIEGGVDLIMADRGPGIPVAHRELIFEKFHRVDNSLTADKAGSGLGLSIARRILRDLGGDLVYEPGKDGGSRFTARIGT